MRQTIEKFCCITIVVVHGMLASLVATPTSLFWTNCTTDVTPAGHGRLDVDSYFSVVKQSGKKPYLAPDIGLSYGLFQWDGVSAEVGADYIGGTQYPFLFNGKLALSEDQLFFGAPSMSFGIFNAGMRTHGSHKTNQNIFNLVLGKALMSMNAHLYIAGFMGTQTMGKDRKGFMVGYKQNFFATRYLDGREYHKLSLLADYASGKNTIGGWGIGIAYNFTPYIDLITGPVWFNDKKLNGDWKWSVQININCPVL